MLKLLQDLKKRIKSNIYVILMILITFLFYYIFTFLWWVEEAESKLFPGIFVDFIRIIWHDNIHGNLIIMVRNGSMGVCIGHKNRPR